MGRDRDSGVKKGGIAGLRRKEDGKVESENPYCGPSVLYILVLNPRGVTPGNSWCGCSGRFSKSRLTRFQTKYTFPHLFSDLAFKIHTRFQTCPAFKNYVNIVFES